MGRKAVFGTMLVLLLLGILPSVYNIKSAEAATSPYSPAGGIKLSPPSANYTTPYYCYYNNTKFNVTVIITNITGCCGYNLWIDYNSTLLALDSWTFDTDPANPLSPTQMAPTPSGRIDTDISLPGSVKVATVWKAATPPYTYSGDSVAAILTFKIIYCPPHGPLPFYPPNTVSTPLTFHRTQTRAVDYNGADILFATFSDGYYEYTTLPPFAWVHVLVEANPNTVNSGGQSTITVRVMNGPNPVQNQDVFLFSDHGGNCSPSSGKTDSNGFFNSTFTAPTVTEETTCTITADADFPEFAKENQTQVTVKPPTVVGGIYLPTNKLSLLAPYLALTLLLAVAAATVVYAKKRKKQ